MQDLKIYDVRAVDGDSAFLIDNGKTAIMYDSGFAFTGYTVAENIRKILGDRSLDFIFLTHSHYDHALGSAYVKRKYPNAKIVAGEYAAKIFEKPSAKAVMRDLDKKCSLLYGVKEYEDLIDELSVDIKVKDNDIINAGDMEFQVIALPGHTKCSIGFYLEENKLLLGSETLGVYAGPDTVMPSYLIGYQIAMDSIKRAEELDLQNILIPHFGLLNTEDTKKYIENGKESAKSTAKEIADILRNGGSNEEAFVYFKDKFYHDYLKRIYPIDAMTLNTNIMIELIKKELL